MLDALISHVIHKQINEKTKELLDMQQHIKNMKNRLKIMRGYQKCQRIQTQERLVKNLLRREIKIQNVINNLEKLREHRKPITISLPLT